MEKRRNCGSSIMAVKLTIRLTDQTNFKRHVYMYVSKGNLIFNINVMKMFPLNFLCVSVYPYCMLLDLLQYAIQANTYTYAFLSLALNPRPSPWPVVEISIKNILGDTVQI